jgi:hypothetical protein
MNWPGISVVGVGPAEVVEAAVDVLVALEVITLAVVLVVVVVGLVVVCLVVLELVVVASLVVEETRVDDVVVFIGDDKTWVIR